MNHYNLAFCLVHSGQDNSGLWLPRPLIDQQEPKARTWGAGRALEAPGRGEGVKGSGLGEISSGHQGPDFNEGQSQGGTKGHLGWVRPGQTSGARGAASGTAKSALPPWEGV